MADRPAQFTEVDILLDLLSDDPESARNRISGMFPGERRMLHRATNQLIALLDEASQ